MQQMEISPYVSVEILCGSATRKPVLNANTVMVLREVDRLGSLNKAVKRLHMGYSHTLYHIADIEKALGFTVVERTCPHGSKLTEEGRRLVEVFEETQERTRQYAQSIICGEKA